VEATSPHDAQPGLLRLVQGSVRGASPRTSDFAAKARAVEVGFDIVLARLRMEANGPRLLADLLA
jgi:hypothetical protein